MLRLARGAAVLLPLLPYAAHVGMYDRDDPGTKRVPAASSTCSPRSASPRTKFYELESGAFPGSGRPDVAVHIPPAFDPGQRAGLVVYFHGWNGCVQAAMADADVPCTEGGEPRPASHLASQLDEAQVNALLVAVELRADMPTGEVGQLAAPGAFRALLRELLQEHVDAEIGPGCSLSVEGLQPLVLAAHSGGYQAVAASLTVGDVPQIGEVVLLDALYGADPVFASWVSDAVTRSDATQRFVDLYTCCGGTAERSRALVSWAESLSLSGSPIFDDDSESELERPMLAHRAVFKRVPLPHMDLPEAYFRAVLDAADMPPRSSPE